MSLPPIAAADAPKPMSLDDLARYLVPLLRRLAEAHEPLDWHDSPICTLCEVSVAAFSGGTPEQQFEGHEPTCPWRQARELLGYPRKTP